MWVSKLQLLAIIIKIGDTIEFLAVRTDRETFPCAARVVSITEHDAIGMVISPSDLLMPGLMLDFPLHALKETPEGLCYIGQHHGGIYIPEGLWSCACEAEVSSSA